MDVDPSSQADVKASIVSDTTIMDPTEVVRAEIARIISDTLNNAVQELGYFPGIVHALSDVRNELNKLREQNGKLLADNTTLSRIVAQQRDEIKQIYSQGQNSDTHSPIVRGLQHQIQQLKSDREKLMHSQSQYLQENRFLHTELERITAGTWHAANNLIPPSQLVKQQLISNHTSPPPPPPPISPTNTSHYAPQQPGRRAGIVLVPAQSAPPAVPSRSSQSSPTTPSNIQINAWKHYRAVPSGLLPPPSTSTSPGATPAGQPRNRSITMPVTNIAASPGHINPPVYGQPSAPRRVSTYVIDLTQEDREGALPNSVADQRGVKRRRTEDDITLPNTSGPTHLDMRTVGTAINSLEQQMRAPASAPATPVVAPSSGSAPSIGTAINPTAWPTSVSIPPFADGAVTTEPDAMMNNEEAEDEEGEEDDEDMTDIWDENGLVKIEICLETAFDEVDGKMICKMCELRSQKFDGKPSEPMTDTDQAALVKHCEEEHPAGWGTLRKGNREEKQ